MNSNFMRNSGRDNEGEEQMKIRSKWLIALAVTFALTAATAAVWAAAGEPGSESDPVVTKSYVDQKITELKKSLSSGSGSQGEEGGAYESYTAVNVPAGKRLIGGEGAEFILRSGEALAIDNGKDGVSDLTGGADLKSGQAVAKNHLLLIPRDDGRGIEAKGELWVMIRGAYTLK